MALYISVEMKYRTFGTVSFRLLLFQLTYLTQIYPRLIRKSKFLNFEITHKAFGFFIADLFSDTHILRIRLEYNQTQWLGVAKEVSNKRPTSLLPIFGCSNVRMFPNDRTFKCSKFAIIAQVFQSSDVH